MQQWSIQTVAMPPVHPCLASLASGASQRETTMSRYLRRYLPGEARVGQTVHFRIALEPWFVARPLMTKPKVIGRA